MPVIFIHVQIPLKHKCSPPSYVGIKVEGKAHFDKIQWTTKELYYGTFVVYDMHINIAQ